MRDPSALRAGDAGPPDAERRAGPGRIPSAGRAVGLRYSPGLDGLRGVAVLAVLAYHSDAVWMAGGFLGVEMFFTLSGYLVTSLLLAEIDRRGRVDLGAFYRSRSRRLVPALVVCVLGTLALYRAVLDDVPDLRLDAIASLTYLQNWHLVLAHVPYSESFDRPSPLLHLWSLGVEGQLYLLWPVLLAGATATFRRPTVVVLALALAALSAAAMAVVHHPDDVSRVYYGTDTRAAGFVIGAALAITLLPRLRRRRLPLALRGALGGLVGLAGIAAFAVLAVALSTGSEFADGLYREGGFAKIALLTALVIAAVAHRRSRLGAALGSAPLVWLGQRSYGIYLHHWPIFAVTRPGIDVPDSPLVVFGRVAATLVVAELSYRFVELPVRRGAIRRWAAGLRGPFRAAPLGILAGAAVLVGVWSCGPPVSGPGPSATSASALGTDIAPVPPATPPPAVAATPTATTALAPPPAPAALLGPPLVIGDSVVLGSADALQAALGPGTTVDGLVGRQFDRGPPIVAAWADAHPGPVVVHLGSNGTVRDRDVDAIVAAVPGRRVVLVNVAVPRRWQQPDNATLQQAADRHPSQVVLVDWASLVATDPGLLGPDRVHPTIRGRTALAEAVRSAVIS